MAAPIVIKTAPPPHKVVVRPKAPYARAVWIPGRWRWVKGKYAWVNGYWIKHRPGYVYIPGRWVKRSAGWIWVGGYWKRV